MRLNSQLIPVLVAGTLAGIFAPTIARGQWPRIEIPRTKLPAVAPAGIAMPDDVNLFAPESQVRRSLRDFDQHRLGFNRHPNSDVYTDGWVIEGGSSSPIDAKYNGLGGEGGVGRSTTVETEIPGVTGARMRHFRRPDGLQVSIYWSLQTNAHEVHGLIREHFDSFGGARTIGLPVSDELDVQGLPGAKASHFRRSDGLQVSIYWSPRTGAREIHGLIKQYYDQHGGSQAFGLPISDEEGIPGRPDVRVSRFRKADNSECSIFWSPSRGIEVAP